MPAELSLRGIRSEAIDCDSGGAKYDLSLALGERDGRLSGFFEYRRSLFADDTIARMLQHFLTLLKAIVADPDRPIARLPMMSEKERRRLLIEWNQTRAVLPKACVHQLFERQAQRTPSALALECGPERLTYDRLNRRANRLARYLKKLGVGTKLRRRHLSGTLGRHGRCPARGAQSRRGLFAARPGISKRTAGIYFRRCASVDAD